jgi:hypothetical protein
MGDANQKPSVARPEATAALTDRAARLKSVLITLAEVVSDYGRQLQSGQAEAEANATAVAGSRLDSIDDKFLNASAWVGLVVLEAAAVKRWQRRSLLKALLPRGIHRDLTDLPSPSAVSAGIWFAVAGASEGGVRGQVLRHTERWAGSPHASAMNAADALLLAWIVDATVLARIEVQSRVGALHPVVEFACWIQALERGENPGHPPGSAVTEEWFRCRSFRGPRRLLARRLGTAAGRCDAGELDEWLVPRQNAGHPGASEGQCVGMVEWAIAAVRAWPDRERLLRTGEPTLQKRADGLRSSVVRHLVGVAGVRRTGGMARRVDPGTDDTGGRGPYRTRSSIGSSSGG